MPEIKLENISKIYDNNFQAVKDLSFDAKSGDFIVLVGPSGCGKTTLLRMVAGLESISNGNLILDNDIINDLHPKDRKIGMVFQNYALYPHMTVFDNLAFPLKIQKIQKQEISDQVKKVADQVGLSDLLYSLPKQLSGGQRQRVALARAMIRNPEIFLFDEPLSNLDAKLRVSMRLEILRLHRELKGISIYVTHDQVEAMTMASRLVVMNNGEIQQNGSPETIYSNPNNLFVAEFIGSPKINVLEGKVKKRMFSDVTNAIKLNIEGSYQEDEVGYIGIRPEHIKLSRSGYKVKVQEIENLGHEKIIYFELGDQLKLRTSEAIDFLIGDTITIEVERDEILLFNHQKEIIKK